MKARGGPIRVLLADDHALFRDGLVEIFAKAEAIEVVGEAENGQEAVALAEKVRPDVVLLDVEMPIMGAEEALEQILRVSSSSKVLILTMYDDPRLVRTLLTLGAHAYIVKNATREELVAAVRTIHRSPDRVVLSVSRQTANRLEGKEKERLSGRELEILLLVSKAMSNRQIASYLHISEGTVKRHLTNIYAKLGVSSRTDAAKHALSSGMIKLRELSNPAGRGK